MEGIIFLSTPSGWRATSPGRRLAPGDQISIHALRVEGDGEGYRVALTDVAFLSTPSGWRATKMPGCIDLPGEFLSTPSGWRATLNPLFPEGLTYIISIHALRVEGDPLPYRFGRRICEFLSTPSGWRATAKTDKVFVCFCAKGRRVCLFKTRKEKICRWRFKKDKFWALIWCEGSGKSVCASASHCG